MLSSVLPVQRRLQRKSHYNRGSGSEDGILDIAEVLHHCSLLARKSTAVPDRERLKNKGDRKKRGSFAGLVYSPHNPKVQEATPTKGQPTTKRNTSTNGRKKLHQSHDETHTTINHRFFSTFSIITVHSLPLSHLFAALPYVDQKLYISNWSIDLPRSPSFASTRESSSSADVCSSDETCFSDAEMASFPVAAQLTYTK